MPATSYIIRHGQTDWNAESRLQGQRDIPLNEKGRAQATGNGEKLAAVAGDLMAFDFVASPLQRARETMERIRAAAHLDPHAYQLEPRLVEICFGDWEGRTLTEIKAAAPQKLEERIAAKWNFIPPGDLAESYEILSWRVGSWWKSLTRPTVAVCHGGVIRSLFKLTGNLPEEEAANMDIPQDRILRFEGGVLEWI